jgi:anti-sigma factor RsiW
MVTADVACPPEQQIAAFLDGALPPDERARLQRHIDGCASCFDLIATLSAQEAQELPDVDPALQRVVVRRKEAARWIPRAVPALGVAAAVLLAVVWWRQPERLAAPRPAAPGVTIAGDDTTRSVATTAVTVEQPRDGDTVDGRTEVRWSTRAVDAVAFDVVVTTPAGDVLWRGRLSGTARSARVGASLPASLPAGQPCYLWVAADLPDGRSLTSNIVNVRSAGP